LPGLPRGEGNGKKKKRKVYGKTEGDLPKKKKTTLPLYKKKTPLTGGGPGGGKGAPQGRAEYERGGKDSPF